MPQLTLNQLAEFLGAKLQGDGDQVITRLAPLQDAGPGDLSFLSNRAYRKYLSGTNATAVLMNASDAQDCAVNAIITHDPYVAFAKVSHLFSQIPQSAPGIHPSAVIDPSSTIDPTVSVGAHVVIGANTIIGPNAQIGHGCVIGENCSIGEGTRLWPRVTIYYGVKVGQRCQIHSGAVIGADGFGFANENGRWISIAQIGGVVIGDDVDIGANTTIDRAAMENTVIANGVKLDNQIQIGHNVSIGENSIIAGSTAIAGSVKIGKHCMIGGAAMIGGHLTLGDCVTVIGASAIGSSKTEPGVYVSAIDCYPYRDWGRTLVRIGQLDQLSKRVSNIEKSVSKKNEEQHSHE